MNLRPYIDKKVQETLGSLDGIKRAEPAPFFYTRVIGRLQSLERTYWEKAGSFLARPAVAVVGLCLILILNFFLLLSQDSSVAPSTVATSTENVGMDNEYVFASSSSFEYENLDQ